MKKKNKRGSGNKNTQFENALSSSMREGVKRMRDFMDSPGMQGPAERQREEQIRKMMMRDYERLSKDEMLRASPSRYMNNELEKLRRMRRKQ